MPNTRHSSRGVHLAMASTFCMPSTSSIRASRPMRRLSCNFFSSWCSSLSANSTSAVVMTLVIMMVSRCSPAPSTTSMMSSKAYSVVRSLMRTQRVLPVQLSVLSAWMIFLRASRFWLGATASSRSRKTWSAFDSEAFCIIFSLEPGVDNWTRRGRRGGRSVIVFSSSYDLVGAQAGNVARAEADGFQVLVGMFAQDGRAMTHLAGGLRHLHGDDRDLDFVVETGVRHPRSEERR